MHRAQHIVVALADIVQIVHKINKEKQRQQHQHDEHRSGDDGGANVTIQYFHGD
ncbi:MAG: hypothetical protein Q7U07_01475 [Gammaproteobacteria bacterium]|nr:hypothetical protein [Gammaproteobacteria bacterium]